MSYSDAVARVSQIASEISGLQGAFSAPQASTAAPASGSASGPAAASGSAETTTGTSTGAASGTFSSALASALSPTTSPALAHVDLGGPTAAGAALPAGATSALTSGQQRFAARLASDTGLDPGVVSSWLLAEESGGAATARQTAGNNDWLNIGYTASGTYGAADSVWNDPIAAADATAGWLQGQSTIPGYGTASAGVRSILATAGQAPATQIAAIQGSGWSSSGYPDLAGLYAQALQ
jgi:hypothetical protein